MKVTGVSVELSDAWNLPESKFGIGGVRVVASAVGTCRMRQLAARLRRKYDATDRDGTSVASHNPAQPSANFCHVGCVQQ